MSRRFSMLVLLAACGKAQPGVQPEPEPAPEPVADEEVGALDGPSARVAGASVESSPVPEGFVDLREVLLGARFEIRYATSDNFTGAPLPGYEVGGAWLREGAAAALQGVQEDLRREGVGLLVYDAYRPLRASRAMVAWARAHGRMDLVRQGYVAARSSHNRGTTVDVSLVSLDSGERLEMGTRWDSFSKASHVGAAPNATTRANRSVLRKAMRGRGFVPYAKEWWHFTWAAGEGAGAIDVPYAASTARNE